MLTEQQPKLTAAETVQHQACMLWTQVKSAAVHKDSILGSWQSILLVREASHHLSTLILKHQSEKRIAFDHSNAVVALCQELHQNWGLSVRGSLRSDTLMCRCNWGQGIQAQL